MTRYTTPNAVFEMDLSRDLALLRAINPAALLRARLEHRKRAANAALIETHAQSQTIDIHEESRT